MKTTHLAYIAGFFDGEGCIMAFTHPQSKSVYPRLVITQRDPAPLEWIHKYLGGYLLQDRRGIWRLRWDARKAEHVLRLIEPYLVLKRDQAKLALTLFELEPDERELVKEQLKGLKRVVAR